MDGKFSQVQTAAILQLHVLAIGKLTLAKRVLNIIEQPRNRGTQIGALGRRLSNHNVF